MSPQTAEGLPGQHEGSMGWQRHTCDWSVDFEQIGLGSKQLGSPVYNEQSLLLRKPSLAVKVILEECDVGFRLVWGRVELLVGGDAHRRCLDLLSETHEWANRRRMTSYTNVFNDALLCANEATIFELMLGEVDGDGRFFVNLLVNFRDCFLEMLQLCAGWLRHRILKQRSFARSENEICGGEENRFVTRVRPQQAL
jgi:hypothetical protein